MRAIEETDRVLRCSDVVVLVRVCRASIYKWEKKGLFPKRIQLGPRVVSWRRSDVLKWLDARSRNAGDNATSA